MRRFTEKCNNGIYISWTSANKAIFSLTNRTNYRIEGLEKLSVHNSCFIISNHISWTDIIMIGSIFGAKIPITKFFLKHSLIYIPLLGLACWGLGMPFLRRYTRKQLLQNPALKTRDIETTKKACRSLIYAPSTLVNFPEGTRFTPAKARAARSPYRHLMPPKGASLAVALGQVGQEIDCLINLTLCYPKNHGKVFIDLLKGRLHEVYAHIEIIDKKDLKCGDYLNDKQFKHEFTLWLRDLWAQKDALLDTVAGAPVQLPYKDQADKTETADTAEDAAKAQQEKEPVPAETAEPVAQDATQSVKDAEAAEPAQAEDKTKA